MKALNPFLSHASASRLKPVLLLLCALLSGCEVTLLNGQDPGQMSGTTLIGAPPIAQLAEQASGSYHPDEPYRPAYRPDPRMGLIRPNYPYRPDSPGRSAYTPVDQSWESPGQTPYYPYYPRAAAPVSAPDWSTYPYSPYDPYYPANASAPYIPAGQVSVCLPGYEARPYGSVRAGHRQSYLCTPRTDSGYAYYPG